jgi:hypothetical protein
VEATAGVEDTTMRRNFHYLGQLTDDGLVEHDRDEVRQALLDLEGALYQLGGAVTISAVRQQIGEDAYVTTGMVVVYDSYSPARKAEEEPAEDGAPAS